MPSPSSVSLATLAARCGLSVYTTARALADLPRIPASTRLHVQQMATRLGYAHRFRGRPHAGSGPRVPLHTSISAPTAIVMDKWRGALAEAREDAHAGNLLDVLVPWAAKRGFKVGAKR